MKSKIVLCVGCCILISILSDKATATDKIVPKLYEEIGCKELNVSSSDGGPTSFECPDVATYANDKCFLKGQTFNVGDDVTGDIVPDCRAGCKCLKIGNETASIVCANIECPELFTGRDWSCVSIYDNARQCCRVGEICDKAKISAIDTCEFGGKSYRIGEQFYPENESCFKCHCADNFNNSTSVAENPNCVKIDCGMELNLDKFKAGCVPIYYKSPTCCPIDYKCPTKDDAIEGSSANEHLTCKFGDLTLKYGDKLKIDDKCLKCECSTPPFVTCLKTC